MFTDVQEKTFYLVFQKTFAIKPMSHFPPHPDCVTALSCETWNVKFNNFQIGLWLCTHPT